MALRSESDQLNLQRLTLIDRGHPLPVPCLPLPLSWDNGNLINQSRDLYKESGSPMIENGGPP